MKGAAQADVGSPEQVSYICFAAQDWWYHNRAHSDFQLMRHVANTRQVLVVNSIGMRMPVRGRSTQPLQRILRKARSIAKLLREPLPGFFVLSPMVVPFYGIRAARVLNAWLVRIQVNLAARRIGLRDPVVIVTIPTAWDAVKGLRRRKLVFNRSDKHSEFQEADRKHIQGLERVLIREADHVLYVSHSLMEEERSSAGQRAHFLDHGVDLEHFQVARVLVEPIDMQDIPRPRIGFFGALDPEIVDFELLVKVARSMPGAQLVLIGTASVSLTALDALPNVHVLGFRQYEVIPAYAAFFDVGLMPWVQSDWIHHCNPIKLKEYLALGLPVVSTDFAEVHRYADVVRIAKNQDDFVVQVRLALDDDDLGLRAARRSSVAADSWAERAEELIALCEDAPVTGG